MDSETTLLKKQLAEAQAKIKQLENEKFENQLMDQVKKNLESGHAFDCSSKKRCKKCTDKDDYY